LYLLSRTIGNSYPYETNKVFQSEAELWLVEGMKTTMPMWWRIARFIETRYTQRARPHYLPELAGFGLLLILAVLPMVSLLAAALERMR